jgi:hypothetical protein
MVSSLWDASTLGNNSPCLGGLTGSPPWRTTCAVIVHVPSGCIREKSPRGGSARLMHCSPLQVIVVPFARNHGCTLMPAGRTRLFAPHVSRLAIGLFLAAISTANLTLPLPLPSLLCTPHIRLNSSYLVSLLCYTLYDPTSALFSLHCRSYHVTLTSMAVSTHSTF